MLSIPAPPKIRTLGAAVYPLPGVSNVRLSTLLPATIAVAVAPEPPPPPSNTTSGTCVVGNLNPPSFPAPLPVAKKFTPLSLLPDPAMNTSPVVIDSVPPS